MPKTSRPTRRQALELLASVPMLPLGGALLSAGGGGAAGAATSAASLVAAHFLAMDAPALADPAAMATMTAGSRLQVQRSDGTSQTYRLGYRPLFVTGDSVPDGRGGSVVAGGCFDIRNRPIIDRSVAGRERQFFSDCPDGTSLLRLDASTVKGIRGRPVFAVVQFEYASRNLRGDSAYGTLPSPIAVLTLDQDPSTGRLDLVGYHNVDTAPAHGLRLTCGASLSPWNTHLASEEYEPDATAAGRDARFRAFSSSLFGDETAARPYHYGHLPEVTVHPDGTGSVRKHYCLGRISRELVAVMPDRRTVLMGDDFANGGLFLFVADRAADLSAGTLYVARWSQTSAAGPGSAVLSWIRLGHARSRDIEALADRLGSADIMDVQGSDPRDAAYTRIPYAGRTQWVRLVPAMEQAAAFLETHRYAALRGASLGFTKMEGVAVNARDKVAYAAMSAIQGSMVDGTTDIRVQGPTSGAVYALNLRGAQKDLDGVAIDSEWIPVDMAAPPALVGLDLAVPDALGNLSHPDRIANPDNIKFSDRMRTLFVGEDSGRHVNNFLWAYNVDTQRLSRILSCPAGAECSGVLQVDDLNGWTYVMSSFQHPGNWRRGLHDRVRDTLDPLLRANYRDLFGAAVGYLTADTGAVRLG